LLLWIEHQMTFNDLLERLKRETEVDLLEILDLSSEELVDLLQDTIEDKLDRILNYYEDSEESYWEEVANKSC
jgi:hypothetical protein